MPRGGCVRRVQREGSSQANLSQTFLLDQEEDGEPQVNVASQTRANRTLLKVDGKR